MKIFLYLLEGATGHSSTIGKKDLERKISTSDLLVGGEKGGKGLCESTSYISKGVASHSGGMSVSQK